MMSATAGSTVSSSSSLTLAPVINVPDSSRKRRLQQPNNQLLDLAQTEPSCSDSDHDPDDGALECEVKSDCRTDSMCRFDARVACHWCRRRMCTQCHCICQFCYHTTCIRCSGNYDYANGATRSLSGLCFSCGKCCCCDCASAHMRYVYDASDVHDLDTAVQKCTACLRKESN